jgi:hypothetical protein
MMDIHQTLRHYLEAMVEAIPALMGPTPRPQRYRSYEHLVYDLGQPWVSAPLPPFVVPGPMRYCYQNTLDLLRQVRETSDLPLRYVEGYAIAAIGDFQGIPCQHAWLIDPAGQIWDRTWPEPERSAYWGIVFDRDEVERFDYLGPDYLGILASEYLLSFPLLRTGKLFPDG